jgi:phage terminase large subunit-like protein
VGVETDQGGDTWQSVYERAAAKVRAEFEKADRRRVVAIPPFRWAKAGSTQESKAARSAHMLADYERGRIRHVIGTHTALERALRRFPRTRPLDLADAAFWSWRDVGEGYDPTTPITYDQSALAGSPYRETDPRLGDF